MVVIAHNVRAQTVSYDSLLKKKKNNKKLGGP